MTSTEIINKVKALLSSEKVKLGSLKSKDESVTFEFEGEMLMVDKPVYIKSPDGENVLVPVGEYELENDLVMVVSEEGIVTEIKEVESEPELETDEEMKKEEEKEYMSKDDFDSLVKVVADLAEKVQKLSAEKEEAPKEEVKVEASAEPEIVKHSPEKETKKIETFGRHKVSKSTHSPGDVVRQKLWA